MSRILSAWRWPARSWRANSSSPRLAATEQKSVEVAIASRFIGAQGFYRIGEPPAALDAGRFSPDDCLGKTKHSARRKHMRQWIALIVLALLAGPAFAQDAYPSRPITMVIAFPPGGVTDVTARPTALAMERVLKQRVIIENKPGAAGATGNAYVANARADGYTVLMALSSISVIPEAERLQGNKPPYELAQFAPIALISADPVVLVVRDEAPRNAVRQAVQDPDFRGAMAKIETPVTYLDAPEFREFWDTDAKRLAEAVKRTRPVEQK